MTNVLFKDEVLDDVKNADEFHEFCRKFLCRECSLNGMSDCEFTFGEIKKELER